MTNKFYAILLKNNKWAKFKSLGYYEDKLLAVDLQQCNLFSKKYLVPNNYIDKAVLVILKSVPVKIDIDGDSPWLVIQYEDGYYYCGDTEDTRTDSLEHATVFNTKDPIVQNTKEKFTRVIIDIKRVLDGN